jgi:uncharacterized protein YegL
MTKTLICLILDCSGSMTNLRSDVIGGVNQFLEDQKKLPDPASIAFVKFNTEVERFRPMTPLAWVQPLTEAEYKPDGFTALLDAIGLTIVQLEKDWVAEKPDRAIFVLCTDGKENSSKEYKKAAIKEMIQSREASGLWSFIYLGANVDAFEEGQEMGFNRKNTAGYAATKQGVGETYTTLSASVGGMRASGSMTAHNLGKNLWEDAPKAPPVDPPKDAQAFGSWKPPTGKWTPPA